MAQAIGSNSYAIDTGHCRPKMAACYLVEEGGELALIDTGTMHSLPRVLAAIDAIDARPEQVRYVMPTHVHLDHAGGAGQLMAACPNATLVVHPKGLPHMIDPSRLQAGATAVYGEEAFARDFGRLDPIPESRTLAAEDGAGYALGGRTIRFIDTPGHANHHGCLFDSTSGFLYTGDTFGLGYTEFGNDGAPLLVATTTPVAFDPDAWFTSLDRMLALSPKACCLTHYGRIDRPERHVDMLRDSIRAHVAIALAEEDNDSQGREERLYAAVRTLLVDAGVAHAGLDPQTVEEIFRTDIELNAQGLGIWLKRRAKRRD